MSKMSSVTLASARNVCVPFIIFFHCATKCVIHFGDSLTMNEQKESICFWHRSQIHALNVLKWQNMIIFRVQTVFLIISFCSHWVDVCISFMYHESFAYFATAARILSTRMTYKHKMNKCTHQLMRILSVQMSTVQRIIYALKKDGNFVIVVDTARWKCFAYDFFPLNNEHIAA